MGVSPPATDFTKYSSRPSPRLSNTKHFRRFLFGSPESGRNFPVKGRAQGEILNLRPVLPRPVQDRKRPSPRLRGKARAPSAASLRHKAMLSRNLARQIKTGEILSESRLSKFDHSRFWNCANLLP